MNEEKGNGNLKPFGSTEEAREKGRRGGIASGKARRAKRDMREIMKIMLDEKPAGKEYTYAQRLTESMLTIAANPKNGAAAVRAYETIMRITGQDEPQKTQELNNALKRKQIKMREKEIELLEKKIEQENW